MNTENRLAGCWRRGILLNIMCGLVAMSFSCGGDDTVAPSGKEPPQNTGIPAVPTMTDPDKDPLARSNSISVIRKVSDYAPVIDRALCSWVVTGQGRYETLSGAWIDCYGDWMTLYTGTAWSDGSEALPAFHGCFDACGLVKNYCPSSWELAIDEWPSTTRFVFMKDGVKDPMPNTVAWKKPEQTICREDTWLGCISYVHVTVAYNGTGQPIQKAPYIRRDRFWVATPWEGGALVARTTGDATITVGSIYTSGCSRTETESFAWTLGATVGGEYEGLKAEINGSITKTFETAFTVSEQEEKSISKTLQGEPNKRTCFVLWVLVEQYSFVDKDGKPFTDPNYEFDPGFYDAGGDKYYAFQTCGTQYEIGKYVFDLTTNELVSMEVIPVR